MSRCIDIYLPLRKTRWNFPQRSSWMSLFLGCAPLKTNMDTQNDGLEKATVPCKNGNFWYLPVRFWGVPLFSFVFFGWIFVKFWNPPLLVGAVRLHPGHVNHQPAPLTKQRGLWCGGFNTSTMQGGLGWKGIRSFVLPGEGGKMGGGRWVEGGFGWGWIQGDVRWKTWKSGSVCFFLVVGKCVFFFKWTSEETFFL